MAESMHQLGSAEASGRRRSPRPKPLRAVRSATRVDTGSVPTLVELKRVSKSYEVGGRSTAAVIEDLSLGIAAPSLTLVTGPSGSGKTTLLALICCMMRPTAGRISVAGRQVTHLPEDLLAEIRRRYFGIVFQSNQLIRGASAIENVMVPRLPCPELNGDLRYRARSLLARLGLDSKAHQRIEKLSGGEQQRVAIARALINNPEVIIADEPTAHLDAGSANAFLDIAREMVARGKSVIVASHDPAVFGINSYSQVVELRDGRLI